MKLPQKRALPGYKLKVGELSGGLNMRDSLSGILDSQLTKCNNMWWRGGMLTTRPGMSESEICDTGYEATAKYRNIKRHNCFKTIDGIRTQLVSLELDFETAPGVYDIKIHFVWVGGERYKKLPVLALDNQSVYEILQFAAIKNNTVYAFTKLRKIYKTNDIEENFEEVNEADMYVPTVATQCKSNGHLTMTPSDVMDSGVQFEGFNLLGSYYKVSFNAYNADIAITENNTKKSVMIYGLLDNFCQSKYAGMTVTAEYTATSGTTYTHSVTYASGAYAEESTALGDGLRLRVLGNTVKFLQGSTTSQAYVDENDLEDNLIFKAPYISATSEGDKDKIFLMTRTEWFGGSALGLAGGSRLFLCGNLLKSEKALVCWSGLNDPLYFSKNCYYYVGNKSEAVTGFGKESDRLVIFKESGCGVWYTEYRQNSNIAASDLSNQAVISFEASSVYFPLVQINPVIGCKNADTVMLCRNRLVWLGDGNKVYSLVTENQYNERSVYAASEMVDRALISENADSAYACDWNGYYCLNFGDTVYLMDYNDYGYTHISSYSKNEDANIHIPWYIWHLPENYTDNRLSAMLALNEALVFFSYNKTDKGIYSLYIDTTAETDLDGIDIESGFTTKLFDFGEANMRKNIEQLDILLGNNGGREIDVRFITDCGNDETVTVLAGNELHTYDAGYIESKALFPNIRNVLIFGAEISGRAKISVCGINFKFRITGGAR